MVVGLEFVLCGVNQDPGLGGINTAIGITNSVGRITRTVVGHDSSNNVWDASYFQGSGNNILKRCEVRGWRRYFRLCIVIQGFVAVRNECPSFLVFVVTFFVKEVDIFNKLVAVYYLLVSLEDIWGIFKSLLFGCKLGGCRIL